MSWKGVFSYPPEELDRSPLQITLCEGLLCLSKALHIQPS